MVNIHWSNYVYVESSTPDLQEAVYQVHLVLTRCAKTERVDKRSKADNAGHKPRMHIKLIKIRDFNHYYITSVS